jgi:hypothetical protein
MISDISIQTKDIDYFEILPICGQSATGNKVAVDGVSIDRIENGMVVSGFDPWDSLGFREQIGLIKKI